MLIAALADAASAANATDVTGWLIQQGPAGVIAVVLGYVWRREAARADAERDRSNALIDKIVSDVVPALRDSSRATEELFDYAREERHRRDR